MDLKFTIDEEAKEKLGELVIGYCCFKAIDNRSGKGLDALLDEAYASVRSKYSDTSQISQNEIIQGIRMLFSSAGIDPTKDRPSGEALIRRVVSGKGIYRINAAVDTNNAISLKSGCPCGVYDLSGVKGNVITISIGRQGEYYEGIGGKPINASGKIVTSDGQSIFGSPFADSKRTAVQDSTSEILLVIYYPRTCGIVHLKSIMDSAVKDMQGTLGGEIELQQIFEVSKEDE